MKVDVYTSETKTNTSLIVPTGKDLSSLKGAAAKTADDLKPWVQQKHRRDLSRIATGELLNDLSNQLQEFGAGLMETSVTVKGFS